MSNTGRIIPLPNPPLIVQNTSPDHFPRIAWGTLAHDGYLVLSNSPETLDDQVMPGPVGTLYEDLSAGAQTGPRPSSHFISGELRLLAFHTNRTSRRLDIGFTVRNAGPIDGTLTWYRKSGQGQSTDAVFLAQSIAYRWFGDLDRWTVENTRTLSPGATASFWVEDVPPPAAAGATTAMMWYALSLRDGQGQALGIDVQVWAREHGTSPDPWGTAPLEPTGAVRTTLPHSGALVRFPYDSAVNGNIFIDIDSQGASQGPGLPGGACNTSPYGWPTNSPRNYGGSCHEQAPPYLTSSVVALAPGACTTSASGVTEWCYSADPLGFDQAGPAGEYLAGWDWIDQLLDGNTDPTLSGLWYRSVHWGRTLRRWNYGEYGTEIQVDVFDPDGSHTFQVGLCPAYSPHSIPWAWYDITAARAGEVPWTDVSGGLLDPGNQYIVADRVSTFSFVTTLTAGAYGPVRMVLQASS